MIGLLFRLLLQITRVFSTRRVNAKDVHIPSISNGECWGKLVDEPSSLHLHVETFLPTLVGRTGQSRPGVRREFTCTQRHAQLACESSPWSTREPTVVASYSCPLFLLKSAIHHGVIGRC